MALAKDKYNLSSDEANDGHVGSRSKLEDEDYVDDGHHGTTTVDNNHVVVGDLGLLFDYNSTLQHCHTCRCSPRRRKEKEGRTASTAPRPLKRKWTLLQCCLCAGHEKKYDDVLNKSYCTNDSDFKKKISYNSTSDFTEKVMMASSEQDSSTTRKSRWLGGNAPSVSKNPFKRERAASSDPKGLLSADSSIEKSLSSTSVQGNNEKSLKKSISSTSLGKTLKRAASKLSLSSSREKSGSSMSVKTTQTDFLATPPSPAPSSKSLKKSVSSTSLGKTLKKFGSKLSLSSREKSGSTTSMRTTELLAPPDHVQPAQKQIELDRRGSASSIGTTGTGSSMGIGESVRTRFIWDHGGIIVYVCVMQNGIKKSYRLLKENEGYHAANATLWAGRCEFRFIVDNVWVHDKDLPAIKTEQGHYNNSIRIKKSSEDIMLIKNPREDNLIAAQIKKIANAEIHEPPKFDNDTYNYPTTTIATDQEPIKIIPKTNITTTYELRKCLSGDETLMLSAAENPDLLSGNETLVNLPNNEDGEASDEEIDDIEMEDDNNDIGSPVRESGSPLFLTEVKSSSSKNTLDQLEVLDAMPELEIVQTEMSADKQGLLESHFAYVGTGENTTNTIQHKDKNKTNTESSSTTLVVGQSMPKTVYFRDVFQASIDENEIEQSTKLGEKKTADEGKVEMDEALDKTTNNLEHVANENKIPKQDDVVKVKVLKTKSNSTTSTAADKSDSQINNIESKIIEEEALVAKNDDHDDKQQLEKRAANVKTNERLADGDSKAKPKKEKIRESKVTFVDNGVDQIIQQQQPVNANIIPEKNSVKKIPEIKIEVSSNTSPKTNAENSLESPTHQVEPPPSPIPDNHPIGEPISTTHDPPNVCVPVVENSLHVDQYSTTMTQKIRENDVAETMSSPSNDKMKADKIETIHHHDDEKFRENTTKTNNIQIEENDNDNDVLGEMMNDHFTENSRISNSNSDSRISTSNSNPYESFEDSTSEEWSVKTAIKLDVNMPNEKLADRISTDFENSNFEMPNYEFTETSSSADVMDGHDNDAKTESNKTGQDENFRENDFTKNTTNKTDEDSYIATTEEKEIIELDIEKTRENATSNAKTNSIERRNAKKFSSSQEERKDAADNDDDYDKLKKIRENDITKDVTNSIEVTATQDDDATANVSKSSMIQATLIDNEKDFKVATTISNPNICERKENDINLSDVSVSSGSISCSQATATAPPTTDGSNIATENKNTQKFRENDQNNQGGATTAAGGQKIQQSYLALTKLGMGNRESNRKDDGNGNNENIVSNSATGGDNFRENENNRDVNIKNAVATIDVANAIAKNISQDIIQDAKGNAFTTANAKIDSKIDDAVNFTENIQNTANMPTKITSAATTHEDNLQQFDGKTVISKTANNLENTESTSNIKIPMLEQAEISTAVDKMSEIPVTDSITTVNELTNRNNSNNKVESENKQFDEKTTKSDESATSTNSSKFSTALDVMSPQVDEKTTNNKIISKNSSCSNNSTTSQEGTNTVDSSLAAKNVTEVVSDVEIDDKSKQDLLQTNKSNLTKKEQDKKVIIQQQNVGIKSKITMDGGLPGEQTEEVVTVKGRQCNDKSTKLVEKNENKDANEGDDKAKINDKNSKNFRENDVETECSQKKINEKSMGGEVGQPIMTETPIIAASELNKLSSKNNTTDEISDSKNDDDSGNLEKSSKQITEDLKEVSEEIVKVSDSKINVLVDVRKSQKEINDLAPNEKLPIIGNKDLATIEDDHAEEAANDQCPNLQQFDGKSPHDDGNGNNEKMIDDVIKNSACDKNFRENDLIDLGQQQQTVIKISNHDDDDKDFNATETDVDQDLTTPKLGTLIEMCEDEEHKASVMGGVLSKSKTATSESKIPENSTKEQNTTPLNSTKKPELEEEKANNSKNFEHETSTELDDSTNHTKKSEKKPSSSTKDSKKTDPKKDSMEKSEKKALSPKPKNSEQSNSNPNDFTEKTESVEEKTESKSTSKNSEKEVVGLDLVDSKDSKKDSSKICESSEQKATNPIPDDSEDSTKKSKVESDSSISRNSEKEPNTESNSKNSIENSESVEEEPFFNVWSNKDSEKQPNSETNTKPMSIVEKYAKKSKNNNLDSSAKNKFITPKQEVVDTTPKSKDIFKEVNSTVRSIEKSKSRSSLIVEGKLEKSASKSKFLENVKQKKELEQKKEAVDKLIRAESQAKLDAEIQAEKVRQESERKNSIANSISAIKKPVNQFDEMPKKLDEVFGSIREAPVNPQPAAAVGVWMDPDFDPGQKEISGISESVKLKKSSKKPVKPEVKKEKIKFELPAKKVKKPKKEVEKEPEPSPPPLEIVTTPPPLPPPKDPTPPPKVPTPPSKDPTPPPPKDPTPPPPLKEPTPLPPPPPPEEEEKPEVVVAEPRFSPTKILPPKIGINGFNGVGRLVLRAALETGVDVKAINDPFVPLNYMVYMLKFDIAHSNASYHKEMTVRESPTGKLVINGKDIQVYKEHDVTKIPWDLVGVNYVVEATEALNTKAEAGLHISKKDAKKGLRMRHILEMENEGGGIKNGGDLNGNSSSDPLALLHGGCKRVIIAGPSPDAPLTVIGVNAEDLDPRTSVISHASAPASALAPVLTILHKKFGIKSCAYTLIRSIRGQSKETMKCTNLGPSTHGSRVKWDYADNLIPTQLPTLDEEMLRLLPFLHKKFHGLCVFVPTPEVSMFDLTLQLENDSGDTLYRDVCLALKEAASEPPMTTVMRYCMKMSNENSASGLFASETHSAIVDAKSGCQVNSDTIKMVIWFDNETGHAHRIVDLITNCHVYYEDFS